MKRFLRRIAALILALAVLAPVWGQAAPAAEREEITYWYSLFTEANRAGLAALVDEGGTYDDVVQVGIYLFVYGRLPGNYITKAQARALGWEGGSLEAYAPGKCIGGDKFGNYEGFLPSDCDLKYTECDIGTLGESSRGAKRLVFDSDGRIYYTEDHYESFTLLYEEGMYGAQD